MMMKLKVQDQNQEEDIREAFKVFDNVSPLPLNSSYTLLFSLEFQDGNGFIDRRELALMMRFSGEAVSEQEIEVVYGVMCCTWEIKFCILSGNHQ